MRSARWTVRCAALVGAAWLAAASLPALAQDISLTAPESVGVGAPIEIGWQGGTDQRDFITIVPAGTPENRYLAYGYASDNPVNLVAPSDPGAYELRYLSAASPYPTLARRPIAVVDVVAELRAPAQVAAGAELTIEWTGPNNDRDFIGLVRADAAEGTYNGPYAYTREGSPLTLRAPDAPGDYELRYMLANTPYRTLGRLPVKVMGTAAALDAPESVAAGATFAITWQGPDNPRDFITIVPVGAAARTYETYVYTSAGNRVEISAPELAGDYEIRYLTGQSYDTLAVAALRVTPVTATLAAPDSAPARDVVTVTWEGPGNATDYVILLPVGADNSASGHYAYTSRGRELRIATPPEAGAYELRYLTGGQRITLATRPITITPTAVPGSLRVVAAARGAALDGATVAVVLDASGSMLQRLGGQRRIDLAKSAVAALVNEALPSSVAFTLRVFGHKEADSCRSDLEIPVGPLDRSAAAARVASIEAMNLARTPIADSLRLTAADISARPGPHLIVLVTDGEETCNGDPAAVIRDLVAAGTDVRVNVVGFAIDELMLQETFAEWARLGNGQYFNARDGAELAASLRGAIDVPFTVTDAAGNTVATGTVNGAAVELAPGTYRIATRGEQARGAESVAVEAGEETVVELP